MTKNLFSKYNSNDLINRALASKENIKRGRTTKIEDFKKEIDLWKFKRKIVDMKKSFIIITFVHLSILGLAQSIVTEQSILTLSKKKFDWMVSKNIDSLKSVLDDRLKYVHSNGWTQSKQEVLDDFISGKLDYQKIEITEASARVYDNTVIVIGKGKFSGQVSKNPFALDLLYTEVYIREIGRWLLASRHSSKLP
jgi:hypothetical protein